MTKTNIISNVCLACVNIYDDYLNCISSIETALTDNKINLLFMSAPNIFGKNKKLYIAVHENDIFVLMKILGSLHSHSGIKNYSINCSNSMIHWKSNSASILPLLKKAENDIKFIMLFSDEGICFCDSAYQRKISTILSGNDIRMK